MTAASAPLHVRNGDATGPVIVSVPHAGRDYTEQHLAMLRPPVERLHSLEDRLVDTLVEPIADVPVVVATAPRVWIDLNRNDTEIDPGLVENMSGSRVMLTHKVRSGLGLIPRRLAGLGELWRQRLRRDDVENRIASIHRVYHSTLDRLVSRAVDATGIAVLLDLHSMPPLGKQHGHDAVQVVIGNRYGQSAAPWATASIARICEHFGLRWAENAPYAGGYIVERHGRPTQAAHAIQLEIDRSLYLDSSFARIDAAKLSAAQAFVQAVIAELARAALLDTLPLAAE